MVQRHHATRQAPMPLPIASAAATTTAKRRDANSSYQPHPLSQTAKCHTARQLFIMLCCWSLANST